MYTYTLIRGGERREVGREEAIELLRKDGSMRPGVLCADFERMSKYGPIDNINIRDGSTLEIARKETP